MNFIDLLIIYFTCGAPFGVYYFYQHRYFSKKLWLTSLLVTLFWFVYAIRLLHLIVTKRFPKDEFDEKLLMDSFEKKISQVLLNQKCEISVFNFREIFERYVGLTKAIYSDLNQNESELFQISSHENKKLATKLLSRRNRSRLLTHQTLARRDFLRMIEKIYFDVSEKEIVRNLTVDFVKIINDSEALAELNNIFRNPPQSYGEINVNELEKDVWQPIEPKLLPKTTKALNFQIMSAKVTTSKPD